MSFVHSWVLLVTWLPLAWAGFQWRRSSRRLRLALKALALTAILLALAQPHVTVFSTKMAVAVLVDTSASIPSKDLKQASDLATKIEGTRGRNWIHVIPFAKNTRAIDRMEQGKTWSLKHTVGEAARGTNLEAAIREGIAAFPSDFVPRLVLISDGKQNVGSVARAAWQAQQLGVPIDTFLLAGRPKPQLSLESVSTPSLVFTGERFPLDLAIRSPRRAIAVVETMAEGKVLGSSRVTLEAGVNRVRVNTNLMAVGAIDLSGTVRAEGLGEVRFARALTLRRPRVLLISQDPAGTESHLLGALKAAEFNVQQSSNERREDFRDYQIVVLNNWDLESIAPSRKLALEEFVQEGGGLLVVGGERNVYVDHKGVEDPLQRTLPAKLAPPRTPEGTCVVLIVDKSSSMEGKKIELARLAAIGVIENLRPIDRVGILIFDNSFQWTVPIRRAEDRSLIKRLVTGITPDGGTQIAPALAEAYRRTLPQNAVYKHIVLLTDGISEEGDSMALAQEAARNRITISTVGLGQDVNRAYLEKIAAFSKGRSYFLTDPAGLEQILLRDVMEHTGSTAVEKPIHPVVEKSAEILNGVGIRSAPPLYGYIKFIAKSTADTILSVDHTDPLLVRWQYGLGRAAVFTSDAKSRWAAEWVGWKGFDRFWANLFRDLLPHSQSGEASVEYDSVRDELVVNYRLARNVDEPAKVPDIFVFGPEGFQRPVSVTKVAEGAFEGRVSVGGRKGLFRLRPLAESRAFPEVGFYRQEEELSEYGSEEAVLHQISEFTGGRFQPPVRHIFDSGDRSVTSTVRLWPGLLGLAILLNLIELILRKWRGILDGFRKAQ
jgi:Ca-activated chloride channel family protein